MGRFGVGAKLAALSQARRVDIYTRPVGHATIFHTFFDLDLINRGEQRYLTEEVVAEYPAEFAELMHDDRGESYESGTLVVWSKVDRLEEGGRFGFSVDERINDLLKFLARTYRRFLDNGLQITLNKTLVELHDPLFLLESPRTARILREVATVEGPEVRDEDLCAEIIQSGTKEVDGKEVTITVTVLPKVVRRKRGEGGMRGRAQPFKELNIPENRGRISILRNGREIYYDVVPHLFIGVEVAFPAALDEYFQVRHVKRGAEPVSKLRAEIRSFLERPIEAARKKIAETWAATEAAERADGTSHRASIEAFKRVEETAPRGMGGTDLPVDEAEQRLEEAAQDLAESRGVDEPAPQVLAAFKQEIEQEPLTVIDGNWPGKDLFDITHLNGRVILKLNLRHPFMRDIYRPIKSLADGNVAGLDPIELQHLARRVEGAIDLLLFTYAKAENLHRRPDEQYGELRTHWGMLLASGVHELLDRA
jgi:hypothetical protein